MNAPKSLAVRLDGWLNPILVKELRQAVRSRLVAALLLVFLAAQLLVVSIFVISQTAFGMSFRAGQYLVSILSAVLFFFCVVFVPLYAGIRLMWERTETDLDLMYTTTIRPGAIIRGKLFGAAAVTFLVYCTCLPFLAFTYLLRGVDLLEMFFLLALFFVAIMGVTQFAILVASAPGNRVLKLILGLVALNVIWSSSIGLVGVAASGPMRVLSSGWNIYGGWEFWGATLTALAIVAMGLGLMYVFSVAMLTPAAADRLRPVRIYITSIWLASGALAGLWALSSGEPLPFWVWSYIWAALLVATYLMAVSEREAWGPRLQRRIPAPLVRRAFAFLWTTGSAGGLLWTSLLMLLTLAIGYGTSWISPPSSSSVSRADTENFRTGLTIFAGVVLYVLAYTLTAALLRRLLRALGVAYPIGATWVLALLLGVLGTLGPYVVAFFIYYTRGASEVFQERFWMVTNPILLGDNTHRTDRVVFAAVWAGLALAVSSPWLVRQLRNFHPPAPSASSPAALAPAPDAAPPAVDPPKSVTHG
jgi:hypothetical protein